MRILSTFRPLPTPDLVDRFGAPPAVDDAYANAYFEELAFTLRDRPGGIDYLAGLIASADENRLRAIILTLSTPPLRMAGLADSLRSLLHGDRPFVVAAAIDGLAQIAGDHDLDQIVALHDHPSPYVRGSVLRYLTTVGAPTAPARLRAALGDPHHVVRAAAIDGLDDLEQLDTVPSLLALLGDSHPHVRQAAQTAIEHLHWARHDNVDGIAALRTDQQPETRASALRYLSDRNVSGARQWLLESLADPSPIVRANAADELADRFDREALPRLRELARDPSALVRSAAERASHILELGADS
ncbi:MAG: hypothetical protein QOF01_4034 [Thermomicrobiales bacterium]|nr:hypothetical protein [Thermomicrobiales bacterium]